MKWIVADRDAEIAEWCGRALGGRDTATNVYKAFGVVRDGQCVGAAVLHNWSKCDMELSVYGPGTMTAGLMRIIAAAAWAGGALRISVRMPRTVKHRARSLTRLGFHFEGVQRRLYGPGRQGDALCYSLLEEDSARFGMAALEKRIAA